jgi:hypothetical protein
MLRKQLLILLWIWTIPTLYAQQQRISLNVSAQPLSKVIKQLTDSNGLQFAFSSDQVDLSKMITLSFQNLVLEEGLHRIFSNTGIAFIIHRNAVTLYRDESYRVTISGHIREKGSGELLIGVIVGADPPKAGAVSNAYGFYSLSMPPGEYILLFNYIGFQPFSKKIALRSSQNIDIELSPATDLEEVTVKADVESGLKVNAFAIRLQEIREIPMILGERDVLKYALLSSGIQKGNEGNSYLYVRGGGPDQNLILIDDAVIYNAYHFLGLASLFSGSELRNAELIKGGFSSKYGGRLSSVLDMSVKDGNRDRFGLDATIGVISSRLMVEGPIVKNKSSFIISARKSYIDKISGWVSKDQSTVLDYGFYDVHAKISTDIGKKDRLMLSAYIGQDAFKTNPEQNIEAKDDGIKWGNHTASLRWNHQFSGKLFVNTSLSNSYYESRTAYAETDGLSLLNNSRAISSAINDYTLKTDIDFFLGSSHRFRFGGGYTKHFFSPITSYHDYVADTSSIKDQSYSADEAFGYAEWGFKISPKWTLTSGLRFSYYKNNKAYARAEPRINLAYNPGKNWVLTSSYSVMNQYMQLIPTSSIGFGLPNDIWLSSDENLSPQQSQIVALGITKKNIANGLFSFTAEGYVKRMNNVVSLRENASLFQVLYSAYFGTNIDKWSELTTQGSGQSYGMEYMIRKEGKHFQGMLSYTLSKTMLHFETLNAGNPFPASYDRRHDLGVFISYRTNKHWKFSTNFVYGTGNAISLPVGEYYTFNTSLASSLAPSYPLFDYEHKNNYRMKPYHRLDISIQYLHLIAQKVESTIEFSIYNVYNRANPFFYQLEQEPTPNGKVKNVLKQVSLFPIMPSISWSLKI